MSGTIPPLPQFTFMAWRSEAQGQLYLHLYHVSAQLLRTLPALMSAEDSYYRENKNKTLDPILSHIESSLESVAPFLQYPYKYQ